MKLKIAMAGCGYFGLFQARAWQRIDGVELVGIADISAETRERLKTQFPDISVVETLNTVLAEQKIDILDVAIPPTFHAEFITPLLDKVPAIICQKPFCKDIETARELVAKADASPTTLIVHENFRFMPWYRKIKELMDAGALGEIRQARFSVRPGDGNGEDAYLARQPYFRQMERFFIHETGIHWIDTFRYLFGEAQSVYADIWRSNPVIAGEDSALIVMDMKTGVKAVIDANRTLDHSADNHRLTMGEFIIEGSKASLSLNGAGEIRLRDFGNREERLIHYEFDDNDFGGDCVFHFQQHVVDCLVSGQKIETLGTDYLINMGIEELAYDSAKSGHKLTIKAGGNT